MDPLFFPEPNDLRKWFRQNHTKADELWLGYHKRGSDKPSITWPESVDEALCVGWIDGIRKSLSHDSYTIRFTPRRRGSIWSAVNIRRMEMLANEGRMRPEGLRAFAARRENKSGIYSYEQRRAELEEPYQSLLRKNKAAWEFFQAQPPSYRKTIGWWVVSAKQEETRQRRLRTLIEESARGKRLR
ncbi:MAG: YdeI/OmpD-associated family protein [Chthoniobacterales bacterium]|nr:YdeI/OmpD-associated family protein [Chthoniobacterales bacterium]